MHEYEYKLHDGSRGKVFADRYVLERDKEYVFYRGRVVVCRIPSDWLDTIHKL